MWLVYERYCPNISMNQFLIKDFILAQNLRKLYVVTFVWHMTIRAKGWTRSEDKCGKYKIDGVLLCGSCTVQGKGMGDLWFGQPHEWIIIPRVKCTKQKGSYIVQGGIYDNRGFLYQIID